MLGRRHFEPMVFACLAEELRCGDVAVIGAEDYGDRTRMLLPWEQCEPKLAGFCEQAARPRQGHQPDRGVPEHRVNARKTSPSHEAVVQAWNMHSDYCQGPNHGQPAGMALFKAVGRRLHVDDTSQSPQ
jgi:hypothetical protein